jgi:TBC1 domain family member 5
LVTQDVIPELHLTRWLRCLLAREFSVENTFIFWDYIFAGVSLSEERERFESLEHVCLSMMFSMRQDLMENEDSAVLGMLMSYKEPEDVLVIIEQAQKVRDSLINGVPWQIEEEKIDETYVAS